jgi:hypothetical protein
MNNTHQFLSDLLANPPQPEEAKALFALHGGLNHALLVDLAQGRGHAIGQADLDAALTQDASLMPQMLAWALANGIPVETAPTDELTSAELDLVVGGGSRSGCMTTDCNPPSVVWNPGGTEVVGQWQWLKL